MATSALQPSVHYRSARNPPAAIKTAVLTQLECKARGCRQQWSAICKAAGADSSAALSPAQFADSVKGFGSGIMLHECDVALAFGSEAPIDAAAFSAWCG